MAPAAHRGPQRRRRCASSAARCCRRSRRRRRAASSGRGRTAASPSSTAAATRALRIDVRDGLRDDQHAHAPGRPLAGSTPASRSASASQVEGDGRTRTISGFDERAVPVPEPTRSPAAAWTARCCCSADVPGDLVPGANVPTRRPRRRARAGRSRPAAMNITVQPAALARPADEHADVRDAGCFRIAAAERHRLQGRHAGLVSGLAGPFTIVGAERERRWRCRARRCSPTYAIVGDVTFHAGRADGVRRTTSLFDGGTRMGGDTIIVCNATPLDPPSPAAGRGHGPARRPDSPLVVYGDTSQDGTWYGGRPVRHSSGYEFGAQAVRPVLQGPRRSRTRTTSGSSRSPTRSTSPATTSSTRSDLFADVGCADGACSLPTVGFTAYGGAGNDLDHRQPGRRPPRRRLRRRRDPRPARRRPHLRRLGRQRRHPHARADDRDDEREPARRRSTALGERSDDRAGTVADADRDQPGAT